MLKISFRIIATFFFLHQSDLSAQKTKAKVYVVSGEVTQTASYCGGARPSEEMVEDLAKAKPYPGKVFYIRKGNINNAKQPSVLQFTTDSEGKFLIRLQPGVYSIIQSEQVKALKAKDFSSHDFITVDKKCLTEWWKKPYYLLEIKDKDISGLKFNFHHACFVSGDVPCRTYTGPMPP